MYRAPTNIITFRYTLHFFSAYLLRLMLFLFTVIVVVFQKTIISNTNFY
jgi:hypothetical protein